VLRELAAQGNTVVVIEHNLEVIKTAVPFANYRRAGHGHHHARRDAAFIARARHRVGDWFWAWVFGLAGAGCISQTGQQALFN
jgi:hypothetical protein